MTWIWALVAFCYGAFSGFLIGKSIRIAEDYQRGYQDAKDFYRPIAVDRIEKDMAIKKEQLN